MGNLIGRGLWLGGRIERELRDGRMMRVVVGSDWQDLRSKGVAGGGRTVPLGAATVPFDAADCAQRDVLPGGCERQRARGSGREGEKPVVFSVCRPAAAGRTSFCRADASPSFCARERASERETRKKRKKMVDCKGNIGHHPHLCPSSECASKESANHNNRTTRSNHLAKGSSSPDHINN